MKRIAAVLFDIDGTLIRTGGAGIKALVDSIAGLDHGDPENPAVRAYRAHGMTDPVIFREIFEMMYGRKAGDDEIGRAQERYYELLDMELDRNRDRYRIMPGVLPYLDHLDRLGIPYGLATGNLERGSFIKLEKGALRGRFTFGGYGSDAFDRADVLRMALRRASERCGRPLAPEEALFIGDTTRDIAASRAAGGRIIAVATGPQPLEELRDADLAVETLEDPAVYDFLE